MFSLGLISADAALADALAEQLKRADNGWQFAVFASLADALAAWSERLPALVLWDAQQSPADAATTSSLVTRLEAARPVPFLFVLGEVPDGVEAFGVTEHLTRPLRLGYLLSRLNFYERLLKHAPDVELELGPWLFVPRTRSLTAAGQESVKLTEKEVTLLEYLYAAPEPVSRDELLAAVWGYDAALDTHTLETHIYRLRRKLMPVPDARGDVFLTDQGGYRLNPAWRSPAA